MCLEVFRETRRRVAFLTAAKSLKRKAVGFFARQMDSSKHSSSFEAFTGLSGFVQYL